MKIILWGTRGSIPRTLTHSSFIGTLLELLQKGVLKNISDADTLLKRLKESTPLTYGGNTTCIEVLQRDSSFVVDLGTGLVDYAMSRKSRKQYSDKTYNFFLTHLHWDHIIGLPFFPPLYEKDSIINIYHVHKHAPEYLRIIFNGVNFPVSWKNLEAKINFQQLSLYTPVKFTNLTITAFVLDHPGQSFGYRFDNGITSTAVALDTKLERRTPEQLGDDYKYYEGLDYLLFDSQYEQNELEKRYDWGHSSPKLGVDLAFRAKIKHLVLMHHSPEASDADLHSKHISTKNYTDTVYKTTDGKFCPRIISGYDGLEIDVISS